jgi:hypothetical protein
LILFVVQVSLDGWLFGAGRLGRVIAAQLTACSPVLLSSDHLGNTTPLDLLTWPVARLCVAVALLRDRPRWWLGGGVAAGIGLSPQPRRPITAHGHPPICAQKVSAARHPISTGTNYTNCKTA